MDITKKRIGIVGGGQLGKMMILEAKRLGFYVAILDPNPECCSHSIADVHIVSKFDDPEGYKALARISDVITYEFEHVNTDALEDIEKSGIPVYPSVAALRTIQDKLTQKRALATAGIPVPRFAEVNSIADIEKIAEDFGYPMMLKARTGGYDGKGNAKITCSGCVKAAFVELGSGDVPLMVEAFVPLEKEVSIVVTRPIGGGTIPAYTMGENLHFESILDMTVVPADIPEAAAKEAEKVAAQVMQVFDGVGTFGIEMFVCTDGSILVNEVAPRPHNSGHWTIEGARCNQFENHIRAIVGLPLGDTSLLAPSVMVNLLGESAGEAVVEGLEQAYAEIPGLKVHIYGKKICKVKGKMGHFTVTAPTREEAIKRAQEAKKIIRVVGK